MNYHEIYQAWLENPYFDEATKQELRSLEHNTKEIEDRFYRELSFGTGGIRGVLGAGTNRMNIYVVRKATQGIAEYILSLGAEFAARGVVIAYDSRHYSEEFSQETACVLASNGIRVYLFKGLRPVPQLSFMVRHLNACAGIMITASHNPAEYNGYKVYWEDGAQIANEQANAIINAIEQVPGYDSVSVCTLDQGGKQGLIQWLDERADQAYYAEVLKLSVFPKEIAQVAATYGVVFTPLHGTGNIPVRHVLQELGFEAVQVVTEQELPNGAFPTVASPNPEDPKAFVMAVNLAKETNAQLIIGTDPDCDRVGIMVRDDSGKFVLLTGNQTGALLTHYILNGMKTKGILPSNGVLITTIVTGELGPKIAESIGVTSLKTLTGFKYIGEKIKEFERSGEYTFLFGYEESYGYLAGTHARDKDGVVAAMLVCEMAAYYAGREKSLFQVLQDLYDKYGCYLEDTSSIALTGKSGIEKIGLVMNTLRMKAPLVVAGLAVKVVEDYLMSKKFESFFLDTGESSTKENRTAIWLPSGEITFPKENVLKLLLENDSWVCIRPSGTEPKLKVYVGIKGNCQVNAQELLLSVQSFMLNLINQIIA
jgi:phosphoglucomutase